MHRPEARQAYDEQELKELAQTLTRKCGEFGVLGSVVQINPGPVVTTFEFKPDAGIKYSRIVGLQDDLCLALRAESILIERVAGKSTVGIQVPNEKRETIWLREVVESPEFAASKSKLTIALGKDINGRLMTTEMNSMPHLLIAGSTGSGKSVAINAFIMSLLYKSTPDQVRLILVDPKRVELTNYDGVPHLYTPIISEPKLASNALRNAVREMEHRLKLLAQKGVRNIDQYNRLFEEGYTPSLFEDGTEEKPLPYIVIIVDELADLMMVDGANVEESITRLAQMARAIGIHLILATQRPSVDVITGLIKANFPARMSFRVATKIDSRTILDANGAECLLGRGDMLYLPSGSSRVLRTHAPFVTEKEIAATVEFWKAQATAQYEHGFLAAPKEDGNSVKEDGGLEGDERRQRSALQRCGAAGLRVRQGIHVADPAPPARWLRTRRPPDRLDGARRDRRSGRRSEAERNSEASGVDFRDGQLAGFKILRAEARIAPRLLPCSALFSSVAHTPDHFAGIVTDQQTAIGGYGYADGPPPDFALRGNEAGKKVFVAAIGAASTMHGDADHLVSGADGTVPGAVLGGEDVAAILRRKLACFVEEHFKRGVMRLDENIRGNYLVLQFGMLALVTRVLHASHVPPRPSVKAVGLDVRDVVGNEVVSQFVALIHRAPELSAAGMDGDADGVANA